MQEPLHKTQLTLQFVAPFQAMRPYFWKAVSLKFKNFQILCIKTIIQIQNVTWFKLGILHTRVLRVNWRSSWMSHVITTVKYQISKETGKSASRRAGEGVVLGLTSFPQPSLCKLWILYDEISLCKVFNLHNKMEAPFWGPVGGWVVSALPSYAN